MLTGKVLACPCLIRVANAMYESGPFVFRGASEFMGRTGERLFQGHLGSSRDGGNTCHVFLLFVQNHVETNDLDLVRAKGL